MNVGMLWYDDDKTRSLEEKVRRAADYYAEKYGQVPNLCFVNPRLLADPAEARPAGIELRTAANMLPHHFWVGVGEAKKGPVQN